jgi:hypothetical protein
MIPTTDDALKQFAQTVLDAHKPYGLKPSFENLTFWHDRLQDLTLEQVQTALDDHVAECPDNLPSPDAIRERIKGDERDPVEALRDEVAELRAVVAELRQQLGIVREVAPVAPVLRRKQKRKPVAMPAQLSLLPELEKQEERAAFYDLVPGTPFGRSASAPTKKRGFAD